MIDDTKGTQIQEQMTANRDILFDISDTDTDQTDSEPIVDENGESGDSTGQTDSEPIEEGEGESDGENDDNPDSDSVTFEAPIVKETSLPYAPRKPYHESHYLMYGSQSVPQNIDIEGTLSFLKGIGYDKNHLQQARKEKETAKMIAEGLVRNANGHFCDFCYTPLTGIDYDVLGDGRERCANCRKTAIKTVEEFVELYESVKSNLLMFFGARIDLPISVEMVNSKTLHKKIGKRFVPTSKPDSRTLGYAIKKGRNKKFILRVENGAPRVKTIMTMAHELTHIWQFIHWDEKKLRKKYGKKNLLELYEGMAMWVEIQYTYLIGETEQARREELVTLQRDDEYGRGLIQYLDRYPLSYGTILEHETPFDNKDNPLKVELK